MYKVGQLFTFKPLDQLDNIYRPWVAVHKISDHTFQLSGKTSGLSDVYDFRVITPVAGYAAGSLIQLNMYAMTPVILDEEIDLDKFK